MTKRALSLLTFCLLSAGFMVATPRAAHAKQCIWNKSGFVLKVLWYHPRDLVLARLNHKSGNYTVRVRRGAHPVQVDQWPTLQGRCTRGRASHERLTAVLEVWGGAAFSVVTRDAAQVAIDVLAGAGGAAVCLGSAGTGCVLAAGAVAGVAGGSGIATSYIPDYKSIFLVTVPSTHRYLDVWGTAWSPKTGRGGVIH